MLKSTIEDNELPQHSPRNQLAADLLARLPQLHGNQNIFYEEPNKDRQRGMYNTLYKAAKRHELNVAIRFYDDGLRVWKLS